MLRTTRSTHVLPIPDPVYLALLHARAAQSLDRVTNRDNHSDSGYLIVDERGAPYRPNRIAKVWKRGCARAGVPVLRLHDGRHTCATLMHLQGVPIVVIAAWLGHVDAGSTMRTYAHAQPGPLLEAAQSFARHVTTRDNLRTV
ncbi:tyrosine-type recombinase/integrase [Rhodococcoides fascians]|uniref:tyrosine-type recombinase/integrase n=1 Tax=Rhodococcoides fascians TaxID=1828 RepID=UPI0009D72541|nr:site-specific integrase [Rhodococcus fascians]